jgi:type II secretory pathway pseudopilin PulG
VIECLSCIDQRRRARGFSLVELAIAVFIMALLVGGLMMPLQSQVEGRKIDETQRILDQARESLLGFVAANGYFPCPADTGSGAEAIGFNHAVAAATTCPATVTGTNVYAGFLPAVALGFAPVDGNGYALDAWGLQQNRVRYAVANATINGVTQPFTRINGMKSATMGSILAVLPTTLLNVCHTGANATCATADMLSSNTIAVIWSLGANAPSGGTAPHEDKNARAALTSYTRLYVQAERSSVAGNIFDDQLTWISPPMLFNRLIAAGTLP